MRNRLLLGASIALSATLTSGCSEPTRPTDELLVKWTLNSAVVGRSDSVAATLSVRNPTQTPVVLVSRCVSIGGPEVAIGGDPANLRGAGFGCLTAMTEYTVPPRDSLVRVFQLHAETDLGQPVEPGTYSVGFYFHVHELRDRVEPLRLEVQ